MKITIAHSPDADDAFMFYALTHDKIDTQGLTFEHTLQDIQKCNEAALEQKFDVSAVSFAAYPSIAADYILMTCGASMGEKDYGPILVANKKFPLKNLGEKRIAIPGEKTTAALLLKQAFPNAASKKVFPFNQIIDVVVRGEADVGLLIHEGQLTFQEAGLVEVFNFGRWWWEKHQLPLPLGGNVIRKKLGTPLIQKVDRLLKQSIQYALTHREEALQYALKFARDLPKETADRFVGMYVNERTLDYGVEGREAVKRLLKNFQPEFVS